MISRRQFLQTAAAVSGYGILTPIHGLSSRYQSTGYFGPHPFIDAHPEAVFIMRTNVDHKMNAGAKKDAGLAFGRSVFVPRESDGIPLTISIPVKPNMKTASPKDYPLEEIIGHVTDPYFVEGVMEGMKELGIQGSQFHLREVNRPQHFGPAPPDGYGFSPMAERVGADCRLDLAPVWSSLKVGRDYNWTEVPNGMWFKRIPHLEPINTPGTWMLNIAKFKAHGMGLTLCCKNLQGTAAHNYQAFCSMGTMDMRTTDLVQGANTTIRQHYNRHLAEGIIPRWADKPVLGGLNMEYWVHRTLDNLSVSPCGLHIIEGIYGRDGSGNGVNGPNPTDQIHEFGDYGTSPTGKAWDYMSNVIIFGKDIFRVDIIGLWVGGHEPGNFGLFHIAKERGMSGVINPRSIPVYVWDPITGTATLTPLENLERIPLLTYYLQREGEPVYHLVNEPFEYSKVGVDGQPSSEVPEAFVLHQNKPNPFNPYTAIEYELPTAGHARIEIYNTSGQLVDVLIDAHRERGSHMAVWNTGNHASGTYFYRFRFGEVTQTRKMTLLK